VLVAKLEAKAKLKTILIVDNAYPTLRHVGPHGLKFILLIKKDWPKLPVICHTALFEYKEIPPHNRPFDDFGEKSSDLTKLKDSAYNLFCS
jgi:hypothetical protein